MTAIINAESFWQYKSTFSLTVDLILPFESSPNMIREVKNLSPNFKQIYAMMFYVIRYSHSDS